MLTLVFLSVTALVNTSLADHLSPEKQARGTPEKQLAGIRLGLSKLSDVLKMYGKPAEFKTETNPDTPNRIESIDYFWRLRGVKLHLLVYPGDNVKGEYIALVEVEGSRANGRIAKTGAGLKIGDTLVDLKRIYGRRFHQRNLPKRNIHDVMIQWLKEEYSLIAVLDLSGRIVKLSLSAPE